jgi:hypothetical protein
VKQSAILLGIALTIGVSIPTGIERIPDPTVKVLVQIVALLAILWAGLKIDPKQISDSIKPPKP